MIDSLDIQKTYAAELAGRLQYYSLISYTPFKALFRCPICGDSSKNKYKRRGYLLEREGNIMFFCHNGCGGIGLVNFLKQNHEDMYNEYRMEFIKPKEHKIPKELLEKKAAAVREMENYLVGLEKVTDLNKTHNANMYLYKRKIAFTDIYFTDKFIEYVNNIIPNKFPKQVTEHPRIVFPLRTEDGKVYGISARSMDPNIEPKYLTIKFDEDHPKIFGLDRYDPDKPVFVVEGPIDSLFLPNCVALVGTDGNIDDIDGEKTLILDNQPRSEQVLKKYQKYISQGHKVFIWPEWVKEKDINDLILAGYSSQDIVNMIEKNAFKGLKAEIHFKDWKKHVKVHNKGSNFQSRK